MRLLTIGILSVFLFFLLYIALHPLLGANWAAGVAMFTCFIGLPVGLLLLWRKEWRGPVAKACNYVIAIAVLCTSIWFLYVGFSEGFDRVDQVEFLRFCVSAAIYYLVFGRFHIPLKRKALDGDHLSEGDEEQVGACAGEERPARSGADRAAAGALTTADEPAAVIEPLSDAESGRALPLARRDTHRGQRGHS